MDLGQIVKSLLLYAMREENPHSLMFKTAEQSSEPTTSRSAVKRSTYRLHLSSRGADDKTLA